MKVLRMRRSCCYAPESMNLALRIQLAEWWALKRRLRSCRHRRMIGAHDKRCAWRLRKLTPISAGQYAQAQP
jgi:hypothetical protein